MKYEYALNNTEPSGQGFEAQKQNYFASIGIKVRPALKFHKDYGLWDRDESGERSWQNVTEHCLVEAARAQELAQLLGLPKDLRDDLMMSAALHDFYKKREVAIGKEHGPTWDSFEQANDESRDIISQAGFSERVVRLSGAVGHGSLLEAEEILSKDELSQDDIAFLAMHYIDDYTIGSDWADSSSFSRGKTTTLSQRMENLRSNLRYAQLNKGGQQHLGRKTFDAQEEVGHRVEARIMEIIHHSGNPRLSPQALPGYIDDRIRANILDDETIVDSAVSELG